MLGAIIGDIIGSVYEFMPTKKKDFELFAKGSSFTDDTAMQRWGRKYPYAGYGARFAAWLESDDPKPYNSLGNGSAMRVSWVEA